MVHKSQVRQQLIGPVFLWYQSCLPSSSLLLTSLDLSDTKSMSLKYEPSQSCLVSPPSWQTPSPVHSAVETTGPPPDTGVSTRNSQRWPFTGLRDRFIDPPHRSPLNPKTETRSPTPPLPPPHGGLRRSTSLRTRGYRTHRNRSVSVERCVYYTGLSERRCLTHGTRSFLWTC